MTISVELPRESGDLVMKALEMALRELNQDSDVFEGELSRTNVEEADKESTAESLPAKQADALVRMARGYLAGGKEKSSTTADHYQVMVHVDEEALRHAPANRVKAIFPARLSDDSAVTVAWWL